MVTFSCIVCFQVGASAGAVPKGGPRKHIISVSTYQMVILMLFNTRERLTYEVSDSFCALTTYTTKISTSFATFV